MTLKSLFSSAGEYRVNFQWDSLGHTRLLRGTFTVTISGGGPTQPLVVQCNDGDDDDGDGLRDAADPGCSDTFTDDDETDPVAPTVPPCSDNRDNDGDLKTDYPADPGCTGLNNDSEAEGPSFGVVKAIGEAVDPQGFPLQAPISIDVTRGGFGYGSRPRTRG